MTREQNEAVHWLNLAKEAEDRLKQLSLLYLNSDPAQIDLVKDKFHLEASKADHYRAEAQKWIDKVVKSLGEDI